MTAPKRPAASRPKPASKPAPKKAAPAAKAATKAPVKPVAKTAPKPVAKPVAEPSGKPVAKPAAKAPTAPAVKAAPEPKPVPEKIPPRSTLIPKLHKVLKANYKPVATDTSRPILDQVLVACCFENAPADVAEKAFARLVETYFDLNEIRVTTVAELAEILHDLPDPSRAALSLRRALQGVLSPPIITRSTMLGSTRSRTASRCSKASVECLPSWFSTWRPRPSEATWCRSTRGHCLHSGSPG